MEELLRTEKLDASALRRSFDWARLAKTEQHFSRLSLDELAAIRLCLDASPDGDQAQITLEWWLNMLRYAKLTVLACCMSTETPLDEESRSTEIRAVLGLEGGLAKNESTWFSAMNEFLASRHPANVGAADKAEGTASTWEVLVSDVVSGLTALRLREKHEVVHGCCYRLCWIPQQSFDALFGSDNCGRLLCFTGFQRVGGAEPWQSLGQLRQGCVPCLLEFDAAISCQAAEVQDFLVEGTAAGATPELLLPPFLRGHVRSVRRESSPPPYHIDIFRVEIAGVTEAPFSDDVLEATPEAVLVASMLLALQGSPAKEEISPSSPEELATVSSSSSNIPTGVAAGGQASNGTPSSAEEALDLAGRFFTQLAASLRVRSPSEVGRMWKGYLECALDGHNPWKELGNTLQLGPLGIARTAVVGSARASLRVTKRALGFESCLDSEAMDQQFCRQAEELEALRHAAVGCAREQARAVHLETLSDPEAFLRYLAHDPVRALRATPAILKVYRDSAGPAQRVLLFAKLMGLSAMAGGLLCGDPRVCEAFEGPWRAGGACGNAWHSFSSCCEQLDEGTLTQNDDCDEAALQKRPRDAHAGDRALALLTLMRLHLARVQLLVTAGSPDTGKTTFFREVFGLSHLRAGLSEEGRTDEVLCALHPDSDLRFRPVYLVDMPGFGDGTQLHRASRKPTGMKGKVHDLATTLQSQNEALGIEKGHVPWQQKVLELCASIASLTRLRFDVAMASVSDERLFRSKTCCGCS
ncbi:unnamed protein product [Symbiodinium sp. CCMP2456]|nr:unnamed protein product [Symbiodinium sp. CCMP2456]